MKLQRWVLGPEYGETLIQIWIDKFAESVKNAEILYFEDGEYELRAEIIELGLDDQFIKAGEKYGIGFMNEFIEVPF